MTGVEVLEARRRRGRACVSRAAGGAAARARRSVDGVCADRPRDRLRRRRGRTGSRSASGCAGRRRAIVPFRGAYARLVPDRVDLVRALIYPVPDPALPFLGVHFTRGIDGEVHVGPTALLAGARDAYSLRTLRAARRRGDARLAGQLAHGAALVADGAARAAARAEHGALARDAARYVPGHPRRRPGSPAAPASARRRSRATARLRRRLRGLSAGAALHVRNAPSPAATSALALARLIADRAAREPSAPVFAAAHDGVGRRSAGNGAASGNPGGMRRREPTWVHQARW